jgi:hypothetical protein
MKEEGQERGLHSAFVIALLLRFRLYTRRPLTAGRPQ